MIKYFYSKYKLIKASLDTITKLRAEIENLERQLQVYRNHSCPETYFSTFLGVEEIIKKLDPEYKRASYNVDYDVAGRLTFLMQELLERVSALSSENVILSNELKRLKETHGRD
jgi:hypothetical protein